MKQNKTPTTSDKNAVHQRVHDDLYKLVERWKIDNLDCTTSIFSTLSFSLELAMLHCRNDVDSLIATMGLAMTVASENRKSSKEESK